MVEDRVPAGEFWLDAQSVRDRGPVGASADEDLIDVQQ